MVISGQYDGQSYSNKEVKTIKTLPYIRKWSTPFTYVVLRVLIKAPL